MNYAAFDISAASTGWAVWFEGDIREKFDQPNWLKVFETLKLSRTSKNWRVLNDGESSLVHGAWRLKTEWSREGEPHAKFHQNLDVLRTFTGWEHSFYEKALAPQQRGGKTNEVNDILVELIGHLKSFHFALGLRTIQGIHRASWQASFIGSQKRGTKRATLLDLTELRARQLGFSFRKDDEAVAIGLLTYGLLTRNITPPWIANEVLRPPLGMAMA